MTTTTQALALARDTNVTLDALAQHFGESVPFAAGLVEAVTGDGDYRHAQQTDEIEPTAAEREDYQRGFSLGLEMADSEAMDAAWGTVADWAQALDAAADVPAMAS